MDAQLRQIENELRAEPDNLSLRTRILSIYQRIGRMHSSHLADLAALGDIGAIEIVGKRPNCESRTRNFYLRWAFATLLAHRSQWDANVEAITLRLPQTQLAEPLKNYEDCLDLFQDSVRAFATLAADHLVQEEFSCQLKSVPVKIFPRLGQAELRHFRSIFQVLDQNYFPHYPDETDFVRDLFGPLQRAVSAHHALATAFGKSPKHYAYAAINEIEDSPGRLIISRGSSGLYYRLWSWRLSQLSHLEQHRKSIIEMWLPTYTA